MFASEVKNMNWVPVTDWSNLTTSSRAADGTWMVDQTDIEGFVENIIRTHSEQLRISYSDFESIFREKNESFFFYQRCLFDGFICVGKDFWRLKELKALLLIPEIPSK